MMSADEENKKDPIGRFDFSSTEREIMNIGIGRPCSSHPQVAMFECRPYHVLSASPRDRFCSFSR